MTDPSSLEEALASRLDTLEQGDILELDTSAVITALDASQFSELTLVPGQAFVIREHRTPGFWALATQTCDLRQPLNLDPFVHVAPVHALADVNAWTLALDGVYSSRYFALPQGLCDMQFPAISSLLLTPLDKLSLLSDAARPLTGVLTPAQRIRLLGWFRRRQSRVPFPTILEESVLKHLRHEIRRRRSNTTVDGHVLAAAHGVYIAAQGTNIKVMFILEVGKIKASPLLFPAATDPIASPDAVLQAAQTGADMIVKPVGKKCQSAGYTIEAIVRVPATVNGDELFYEYEHLDVATDA